MAQVKALIGNIKGQDGVTNVYNTSETVIGTFNGATLYRKIFAAVVPSTSSQGTYAYNTINTGINYTKVINVYLMKILISSINLAYSTHIYGDDPVPTGYAQNNAFLIRNATPSFNGATCYVAIEYIK